MKDKKKHWTRERLEKIAVGKHTALTIPVDIVMEAGQRILDLSEVEEVLRGARLISQQECDCRKQMGNCTEPMDGCLSFDEEAEEMIRKHGAHEVAVEDALASLERTHQAGMVHLAYTFTGKEKVGIVCSCCACCCHTMVAALEHDYPGMLFSSGKVARDDGASCVNCGKCVSRCQFGAREMKEGNMVFTQENCFGCGLCATSCQEKAISMVKRAGEEA